MQDGLLGVDHVTIRLFIRPAFVLAMRQVLARMCLETTTKYILGSKDPGTKSGRKIPFGCSPWRAIAKPTLESNGSVFLFNDKVVYR